ncbi:MAG: hypothetical protein KF819_13605 [Labilithrix sp.]|nr:hypothetical protein [Labilithrix sp.]
MRMSSFAYAGLACLSLAILSGACGLPTPPVSVVKAGSAEIEAIRGDNVKFRRGGQEAYGGLRPGYYVVRGLDDWRAAWPQGKEPALPATLDTRTTMMLLAVSEEKETVELKVRKVFETGDKIHVWVKETLAGEGCTAKAERTPFDAVSAPRIDKPVKFYVEAGRAESCGAPPSASVQCRIANGQAWSAKVAAQPGDTIDCEMSAESRGKFALVDRVLSMGEMPAGSSTKLAYTNGAGRGTFPIDVFGTYTVRAEAGDESGRKGTASAAVEALPPKTKDVLVQLIWTNFDVSDDPDTFPRVKLRAFDEAPAKKEPAKKEPPKKEPPKREPECSLEAPRPELCQVKTHSAYTHMKINASSKKLPLEVLYVDERIEKGPLVCVQLYFDGARTAETCDRNHRDPDAQWAVGTVDMATGKLLDPPAVTAGAPDAGPPNKK